VSSLFALSSEKRNFLESIGLMNPHSMYTVPDGLQGTVIAVAVYDQKEGGDVEMLGRGGTILGKMGSDYLKLELGANQSFYKFSTMFIGKMEGNATILALSGDWIFIFQDTPAEASALASTMMQMINISTDVDVKFFIK